MCANCWAEAGSPTDWTPRTGHLIDLIEDLYRIDAAGGPLHVALDDWNVDVAVEAEYGSWRTEDLDRRYYQGWPVEDLDPGAPAVTEGLSVSIRELCDQIAGILSGMTVPQRLAALAYWSGLLPIPQDA